MLMIELNETRDGVDIFYITDAVINEHGEIVRDEKGLPIPSGFLINRIGTDEFYTSIFTANNDLSEYEVTDIFIEPAKD